MCYRCGLWLVNETVLYFFLFARLEEKGVPTDITANEFKEFLDLRQG